MENIHTAKKENKLGLASSFPAPNVSAGPFHAEADTSLVQIGWPNHVRCTRI